MKNKFLEKYPRLYEPKIGDTIKITHSQCIDWYENEDIGTIIAVISDIPLALMQLLQRKKPTFCDRLPMYYVAFEGDYPPYNGKRWLVNIDEFEIINIL